MVESEAKELSEEIMLGAVMFGHRGFQPVIEAIIRMAERSARSPRDFTPPDEEALYNQVKAIAEAEVRAGYAIPTKEARHEAVAKAKDKVLAALTGEDKPDAPPANKIGEAFKHLEKDVVRNAILDTGLRIDGRDTKTVRQIVAEAGVLPRTHGSALFTRGETQALVVTTLGTGEDEQYIDSLDGTTKGTFLLHYNFPPFSVGETGRMGAHRPPRDRPRQARLARHPPAAAAAATSSPTRSASSPRSPSPTARRRWRRSAALRSR